MEYNKKKALAEKLIGIIEHHRDGENLSNSKRNQFGSSLLRFSDRTNYITKSAAVAALGAIGNLIMPQTKATAILGEVSKDLADDYLPKLEFPDITAELLNVEQHINLDGSGEVPHSIGDIAAIVAKQQAEKSESSEISIFNDMVDKLDAAEVLATTMGASVYALDDLDIFNAEIPNSPSLDLSSINFAKYSSEQSLKTEVKHEPMPQNIDTNTHAADTGGLLLCAAIAAVAISKGVTAVSSIHKLFKKGRDLNELTLNAGYSEELLNHTKNLRKLADGDKQVEYMLDNFFTGQIVNDFDNLLTTVISMPQRNINGLRDIASKLISPEKYNLAREKVAKHSAELSRTLIDFQLSSTSGIKNELRQLATHSNDISALVLSAHNKDKTSFERDHPELTKQMRRSGILTNHNEAGVTGFGELFSNAVTSTKRILGMDNGDVIQQAKLAINLKTNLLAVNGIGSKCEKNQKDIISSIHKVVSDAPNNELISEDTLQSLREVSSKVCRYVGVSHTTSRSLSM